MKGVLVFLGVLAAVATFLALSYVSAYNYGNKAERELEASLSNNKNILASYTTRVMEAAQIPAMQRDDVAKVMKETLLARYGEKGSQATFQWIQEQNIQLDPSVYKQLQQMIEAGRREFQAAQTDLIDKTRGYKTNLGYLWTGFLLRVAGYPTIDLKQFDPVINTHTQEAFDTKIEKPLELRPTG